MIYPTSAVVPRHGLESQTFTGKPQQIWMVLMQIFFATCNNDVFTCPTHNHNNDNTISNNRLIQYTIFGDQKTFLRHHFSTPETRMTFTKSATPSVAKLGRARRSRNKGCASEKSRTSIFIVLHRAAVRRVQPLKLMVSEKYQHFSDSPCKIFFVGFVGLSYCNNFACYLLVKWDDT